MTILGNLFLFFAAIAFIAFNSIISKPPPRNDGAVGYYWTLIIVSVVFLICMIVVVVATAIKGYYNWISPQSGIRFIIVSGGLLCAVIATAISALLKFENGPVPFLLRLMAGFAPLLIPLLLIVAHFLLINKINVAAVYAYKLPLLLAVCLGVAGTAAAAWGWITESNRNHNARIKDRIERQDANHQRMLDEIDSCDLTKNMVFLYVFTDANQDADVRTKAVAKIKTHPQWQQEMIARLQNDWAPEPFTFLASNDVEDPSLFPEAIKAGVLIQAKLIRDRIRNNSHPANFYPGLFSWEVERVLRTVDRFEKNGVDYLPVIKELRAALNERSEFEKPEFICKQYLDDWIKKHSPAK